MQFYPWTLIALALLSFHAQAESPRPLKVLSLNFNSEVVPSDHGAKVRSLRLPVIENEIREKDIDIVLIQEGWNYRKDASVGETLARDLGYDVAYRVDMGFPFVVFDSNVILAKKELRLSQEVDTKLPHSAGQIGDGKKGILVLGAISYGVGAQLVFEGQPLYVFTTHLVGSTDKAKRDQLLALSREIDRQILKDGGDPRTARAILTGDLNLPPSAEGIRGLIAQGYLDTFARMHPEEAATICTFCGNPNLPWFNPFTIASKLFPPQTDWTDESRYDYIFIRGENAAPLASTLIFTAPVNGIPMSDHYGVLSTLTYNPALAALRPENPLRDSSDETPPTVLHLTDQMLAEGKLAANPLEVRNFRGLAVINESSQGIDVRVRGPALIYNVPQATLRPQEGTAFTFIHSGKFLLQVRGRKGFLQHHDKASASVNVLRGTLD